MTLTWYCAMCGKQKEIDIPTNKGFFPTIPGAIEREGWIIQHNTPNIDIYCSKKCAK